MIDNTGNSTSTNSRVLKTYEPAAKKDTNLPKLTVEAEGKNTINDQVDISYNQESVSTYHDNMSLEQTVGDGFDLLRGLVLNIFKEQGLEYKIETTTSEVDLETITPEQAGELVAEDGYFGVEKTAERIFNFAVGVAGGDPTRLDAIKEGINNGFQEALEAFGGKLPDISYDTFDAVINKLDEWAGIKESPESSI